MKQCYQCKIDKPASAFHAHRGKKDGLSHICKECNCDKARKWHSLNKEKARSLKLKKAFGITVEEYDQFAKFCDYRCAICNEHQEKFSRKLAVDHDHSLGHVRGLLCINCNKALGLFKDNLNNLKSAIQYLENYEEVLKEIENAPHSKFK